MCPPGLGLLWAGEKALARNRGLSEGRPRISYVDWEQRLAPDAIYQSYAGTPPVTHLRALDIALDMIDEEGGLDAVWARHQVLADAVRAAVEAWSVAGGIELNIHSPRHRSNAVTTIRTGSIDATELARRCEQEYGVTIGIGLASEPTDDSRGSRFDRGRVGRNACAHRRFRCRCRSSGDRANVIVNPSNSRLATSVS